MTQPTRTARPRLPAFAPVPIKRRADGWTPVRQAEFIGVLAETGSVSAAARFVGMARETAYRLRRKPGAEEFARSWDIAMQISGARRPGEPGVLPPVRYGLTSSSTKVTPPDLWRRIVDGRWRPVMRRGKYVGSVHKPDNSALLGHLARLDRSLRQQRKELRAEQRSQAQKDVSVCGSERERGSRVDREKGAP
jgi:hypothetical protein